MTLAEIDALVERAVRSGCTMPAAVRAEIGTKLAAARVKAVRDAINRSLKRLAADGKIRTPAGRKHGWEGCP